MAAVAVAMAICAGSTLARAPSQVQPAASAPIAPVGEPISAPTVQLAALEPVEPVALPAAKPAAPVQRSGPFGLAAADQGSFSARWQILQPSIRIERKILALCRANSDACPAAAAKFGAIVESARARSGLAQVGEVNRAVNLAIRPVDDLVQYGVPDVWASPLMTFGSGAGDCEDYAIAKYVALLEAGMASADLRLVVVNNRPAHENHMVTAARIEGRWLILDNRTMRLVTDDEITDYTPLAMLDSAEPSPAIAAVPLAGPPAESWTAEGFTVAL